MNIRVKGNGPFGHIGVYIRHLSSLWLGVVVDDRAWYFRGHLFDLVYFHALEGRKG